MFDNLEDGERKLNSISYITPSHQVRSSVPIIISMLKYVSGNGLGCETPAADGHPVHSTPLFRSDSLRDDDWEGNDYFRFAKPVGHSNKSHHSWSGPDEVMGKLSPVACHIRVSKPSQAPAYKWVHVNQIKLFRPFSLPRGQTVSTPGRGEEAAPQR